MLILPILIGIVAVLLLLIIIRYHWNRRKLYALSSKLNGPITLPLIGNGLRFLCKNEEILPRIQSLLRDYGDPCRFWLGPEMLVCFKNPEQVEKIFSSSKFAHKHDLYKFVKVFLGEGLVSGSGPMYKKHRRIIQPLFNIKYCSSNIVVFQKYMDICIKQLDKHVDNGIFDISHILHKIIVDIVGEIILGTKINAHKGKNKDYVQAAIDIYDLGFTRITRPWLYPDVLFNLSSYKKRQDEIVKVTQGFVKEAIFKSSERRKLNNYSTDIDEVIPIIDQIADLIENNPDSINDIDFMYHMFTLFAASEDTLTIISSFVCMCLGMYPEYQRKVAQEIREVFGETPRPVKMEDIGKLNYLDMCIKDVQRLVPIAPYILRKSTDEIQIDEWILPCGTPILIPIFDLHRDPSHWQYPNHFHPDHFLPEAVSKRHVYSFVPFSAGPRGCIGKILANVGLKVILANILQHYELQKDGKFPDCKLKVDISTRPFDGYKLRIQRRQWP